MRVSCRCFHLTVSGSGKTLLAVELVRMLMAARGLGQKDVTVVTGAEGTEELQGWIKGYGGLEGAEYSKEHDSSCGGREWLEALLVLEGKKNKIVIADECWGYADVYQDWRWLASLTSTADIVVCAKPSTYLTTLGIPPCVVIPPFGPGVLSCQLKTPHRQGWQPRQMCKYVTWHHNYKDFLRSDMEEALENLPASRPLLWLDLKKEGLREEEVVREVMDLLKEQGGQKTGIWVHERGKSMEVAGLPTSWRALEENQVHGIEAEVTCFYCAV